MAKESKPKPEKKVITEFYGVNIKLLSPTRSGEDMYIKLFNQIFANIRQIEVGHGKAMCLLLSETREAEVKGKKMQFFRGEMAKFTLMETDDWLDIEKKLKTKHSVPDNLRPNLITEEYLFIPYAHRFFFKASSKITVNNVVEFFQGAAEGLIGENEVYSVDAITSQDQVDRILKAFSLLRLEVELTYTNDDLGTDASEVMDELFKEGNAAKAKVIMTPRSRQEGLDTKSTVVSGLVQLGKDNGRVLATIKESQKKKVVKVNNKKYPERISVEAKKTEDPLWELFVEIVSKKLNESGNHQQNKE